MLRILIGVIIGVFLFQSCEKQEIEAVSTDDMVITEWVTPQQVAAENSVASLQTTLDSQKAALQQTTDKYNTDLLKKDQTITELQQKLDATNKELVSAREQIAEATKLVEGFKKTTAEYKAKIDDQEVRLQKLENEDQEINWITDINKARDLSLQLKRPLYIGFELNGCKPCLLVKKNTYENPAVQSYLKQNFIPVWIFVETPQDPIVVSYGISEFPKGIVSYQGVDRIITPSSNPQEFLRQVESKLPEVKKGE